MNKVRVRYAPSPTGYLHVGGLRSALYNYLFARQNKGAFILRIEDTDKNRFIENAIENIIKLLQWAGLKYEEGVFVISNFQFPISKQIPNSKITKSPNYPNLVEVGNYGPYIQSERLDIYKKYAQELIDRGTAYYCFCAPERLEEMRNEQSALKKPPMYDRYCLKNLNQDEINQKLKENCPATIRLKIPEGKLVEFEDIVRGKVIFKTDLIDDQVLIKSDGYPTYHLASIVDDHLMEISHVIRGEEWLSSAPKHILMYEAFGWDIPQFAHLPLILTAERKKLSKRIGDVSIEDYVKKGYLKDAIINFIALLGWNPGKGSEQEIFSLPELIKKFDLKKVHKGGAVFDPKKLDWINSRYIKKLSVDELYDLSIEFFKQKDFYKNAPEEKKSEEYVKKVLTIEQERLENLSGAGEGNKFFFTDITYEKNLLRWKNMSDNELKNNLEKAKIILESISDADWTKENLEKILLKEAGDKRGELLWPLRVALTGERKSPPPFEVAWVLGKTEIMERINKAVQIAK